MSKATTCRAGNPNTCTDANCPQKRAAFEAFVATLNGEKAKVKPQRRELRREGKRVVFAKPRPSYANARAVFEKLVDDYEVGTANMPEDIDPKLQQAYLAAAEGLETLDKLEEIGAKTNQFEPRPKHATLRDAREAFQRDLDYWNTRRFNGDPLFDQWMVDAVEADENGLAMLNWLEDLGADTGAADILPKVPHAHKTVELKVRPALYEPNTWHTEVIFDDNMHIYSNTKGLQAQSREEAYALLEAEVRKRHGAKISPDETRFKRS
jgi:hypothetical protein